MSDSSLLFLLITDATGQFCTGVPPGPKYTRDGLRTLLCTLGCKPRHAYKAMAAIFETVEATVEEATGNTTRSREARRFWQVHNWRSGAYFVALPRQDFNDLISTTLSENNYKISASSDELKVACSLREKRKSVTILLAGTSGTGKSTLASLLASRLGITTVLSTDSIRHMLRSFHSKEDDPLVWASTYSAGEGFDESKTVGLESMSQHERTIKGYKAQCEVVMGNLDRLITRNESNCESMIVEGVHLSINFVVKLMQRHPSIIPFLVFIKNEAKHTERMAVRARYMTLDPNRNRYVKYMRNIRLIQEYLLRKADKFLIPRVENSNMDRSVGLMHLTVLGCAKRLVRGEPCLDASTRTAKAAHAEFTAVTDSLTASSKDILEEMRQRSLEPGQDPGSSSGPTPSPPLPILHPLEREASGSDSCRPSGSSSPYVACAGACLAAASSLPSGSSWQQLLPCGECFACDSMEGLLAAGSSSRHKRQVAAEDAAPVLPGLDLPSSDEEHPLGASTDDETEGQHAEGEYGSMYESATDMTDMDDDGEGCGLGRPTGAPSLVMAMLRCRSGGERRRPGGCSNQGGPRTIPMQQYQLVQAGSSAK